MTQKGPKRRDQNAQEIAKHDLKNDIELGSEFQIGNSKNQSQKKSGRQANKK